MPVSNHFQHWWSNEDMYHPEQFLLADIHPDFPSLLRIDSRCAELVRIVLLHMQSKRFQRPRPWLWRLVRLTSASARPWCVDRILERISVQQWQTHLTSLLTSNASFEYCHSHDIGPLAKIPVLFAWLLRSLEKMVVLHQLTLTAIRMFSSESWLCLCPVP